MSSLGPRLWLILLLAALPVAVDTAAGEQLYWPQFRGPNSAGVAADEDPPVQLSVERELLWKTAIPGGHGSPCIWKNSIFLSGYDQQQQQLLVFALDRSTGHIQWQREVKAEQIERVHEVSSPATATIATDGQRIYVYFGSVGLLCFNLEGEPQWECRLPIPGTRNGSGTSPIVAGDFVILNRDCEDDAFLLAVDRHTGQQVWRQKLPVASIYGSASCATPVIWHDEIILHRTGEIAAYKTGTGERSWWCSAAGTGSSTPVASDKALYVNTWNNFGEPELRVDMPAFNELLKENDSNGDKKLSKTEFPEGLNVARRPEVGEDVPGAQFRMKWMFDRVDANKDGQLTSLEWLGVRVMMAAVSSEHGMVAIGGGGSGDVTHTKLLWKESRAVAEIPSPLFHNQRVYMVKDGGIVTCMMAETGEVVYRERLGGTGAYHSSPVLAADRIYIASTAGVITVFSAGDAPQILATCDVGEPIRATPAIVENCLYVRTQGQLLAFSRR